MNEEKLLVQLYSGKIVIPQQVYNELSDARVSHLRKALDGILSNGDATVTPILTDDSIYKRYIKMTNMPDDGQKTIGKGEAAAFAFLGKGDIEMRCYQHHDKQ